VVPILVGETLTQAKKDLESVGLELDMSGSTYRDSDKPKGYILGNNLAGQEVPKGTKIAVYMSSGIAKRISVTVKLPTASGKGKLVATLNDEEVEARTVKLSGETITLNIGGSGSSNKLVVTIDGQKIYSATINFSYGIAEEEAITSEKEYKYTTEAKTTERTTENKTEPEPTSEMTVPQSTTTTEPTTTEPSSVPSSEPSSEADTSERQTVDYDAED
ncbi:MAG: PASTA domain-containing protein, partial [Acutalibacteraceae bacterium]